MCGIAGTFHLDGSAAERPRVARMTALMNHRGPDHQACVMRGPFGLGHARLSIIDVSSAAHQPMLSPDGRHAVVFNGEIYNYREIKSELEREGVPFRTTSDTEVLLEAFRRWGVDSFARLNGMFAVAFVDFDRSEMTLVRDRFGIKPLYYAREGHTLYFASEVKTILAGLDRTPPLDTLKLTELLVYRELIQGTFFRDIKSLEPGAYVRVHLGSRSITEVPWFVPEELVDQELAAELQGQSYAGRIDAVDRSLRSAVERHLISDVPVGTLCSGGTDSSLLTALCTELNPAVSVYHVNVQDLSERRYAEMVARHLGIDMHYVELSETTFLSNYVDCIYYNDFPLTHPNGIGVFLVSELARKNRCKVLLTGEGADETFGGYDWRYRNRLRFNRLARLLKWPTKAVSGLSSYLTGVWLPVFDLHFNFKARALIPEVLSLCSDLHFRRDHWARCYARLPDSMDVGEREIQASLISDLRDYISGILHRQDRASMQASIESRVPFLDHTLAKVAVNLPLRDKVQWLDYKPLLKDLAGRYLPRDVVFREKVGFGTPADVYARKIDVGVFKGGFVENAFGITHAQADDLLRRDFATFGHQLLGLEFWGRMFVLGESRFDLRDRFVPIASPPLVAVSTAS